MKKTITTLSIVSMLTLSSCNILPSKNQVNDISDTINTSTPLISPSPTIDPITSTPISTYTPLVPTETLTPQLSISNVEQDSDSIRFDEIENEIHGILEKKDYDCNAGVSLYKIQEQEIIKIIELNEDRPLDMMSLFKIQLATLYYISVPQDLWENHSKIIQRTVYDSDPYTTTTLFKIIEENTNSDNALEDLNNFLLENNIDQTIISKWKVKSNDYMPSDYSNTVSCQPHSEIIDCNKTTTATDINIFYSRLISRNLTWNGQRISQEGIDTLLSHIKMNRTYPSESQEEHNNRFYIDSGFDTNVYIFANRGTYYDSSGKDPYPVVHNEAGIINTGEGIYSFAVLAQGCGGFEEKGNIYRTYDLFKEISEKLNSAITIIEKK